MAMTAYNMIPWNKRLHSYYVPSSILNKTTIRDTSAKACKKALDGTILKEESCFLHNVETSCR